MTNPNLSLFMKTLLFYLALTLCMPFIGQSQETMTFSSGATEAGFTFNGWTSDKSTIWMSNTIENSTATCTINSGTWNFISFYTGPYTSIRNFMVTSNKGDSYSFKGDTVTTHTLNWTDITSVTFTILNGNFQQGSCDFDDFVYSTNTLDIASKPSAANIVLYPNPIVGNKLYLSNTDTEPNLKVEFYNVIGKLVKSSTSVSPIDVSDLTYGVYLVKVKTHSDTFTQKLFKK